MRMVSKTRFAGAASAERNTDFSGLYTFGAVLCWLFSVLPFAVRLIVSGMPGYGPQLLFLLFFLCCGLAGYGLQMLTGWIFHIVRPPVENSYEDTVRHRYKLYQAVPVHLAAVFLWFLSYQFAVLMMRATDTYVRYSAVPLFSAAAAVLLLELGAALWFYPYHALISMRRLSFFFVLLLINFYLSFAQAKPHMVTEVLLLCLSLALFLLLLNQSFITRKHHGKVARGINDRAKLYSVQIVLTELLFIGLGAVVLMALMVALVSFWKLIVQFLVTSDRKYIDVSEVQSEISTAAAGAVLKMGSGEAHGWMILFYVLFFLCLLGILIAVIPSLREKAKHLIRFLRDAISYFLTHPFSDWRKRKDKKPSVQMNFVDTVDSTRKPSSGRLADRDRPHSYADFQKTLGTLPDADAQIRYAYAVVAEQLQHQNCQVRPSDTPRELSAKVNKRGLISDIGELSAAFEEIHYQNLQTDPQQAERILRRLCVLAETFLF